MDLRPKVLGLAALVLTLVTGPALAQVALDGAGALQQYCADADGTPHPTRLEMRQVMTTDELATFGGTIFAAVYQPDAQPEQVGRMIVRLRVVRADGSREQIGRFSANQQVDGVAQSEQPYPVAVRQGDTVVWRYRFKNFADLSSGSCFLLIGATLLP